MLCPCEEPRFDAVAAGHAADLAVTGRHCTHGAGVDMIVQYDLLGQLVNKPRKIRRERVGSKALGAVTAQHDARSDGLFADSTAWHSFDFLSS